MTWNEHASSFSGDLLQCRTESTKLQQIPFCIQTASAYPASIFSQLGQTAILPTMEIHQDAQQVMHGSEHVRLVCSQAPPKIWPLQVPVMAAVSALSTGPAVVPTSNICLTPITPIEIPILRCTMTYSDAVTNGPQPLLSPDFSMRC